MQCDVPGCTEETRNKIDSLCRDHRAEQVDISLDNFPLGEPQAKDLRRYGTVADGERPGKDAEGEWEI